MKIIFSLYLFHSSFLCVEYTFTEYPISLPQRNPLRGQCCSVAANPLPVNATIPSGSQLLYFCPSSVLMAWESNSPKALGPLHPLGRLLASSQPSSGHYRLGESEPILSFSGKKKKTCLLNNNKEILILKIRSFNVSYTVGLFAANAFHFHF